MLIPAFAGHPFKAYDKNGEDITPKLFRGFMVVDADYSENLMKKWTVQIGPKPTRTRDYQNIYAPGIAFAPPHSISKPRTSKMVTRFSGTSPNRYAIGHYRQVSGR